MTVAATAAKPPKPPRTELREFVTPEGVDLRLRIAAWLVPLDYQNVLSKPNVGQRPWQLFMFMSDFYAYMVVLDADSLMCGETLASLAARMDAEPRLGLLQTVPTIVGAQTPFARLQQFASRLYGPVFALGQQW